MIELTNYTILGNCSNCGQCCSDILHLNSKEIKKIDRYLKKHKVEQHNKGQNVIICPFRNEEIHRCEIYEVRPEICRIFKCDKTPLEAYKNREFTNFNKKPRSMAELFFQDDSKLKFIQRELKIKLYRRNE
jgi:Fe-S-cluster containining protein